MTDFKDLVFQLRASEFSIEHEAAEVIEFLLGEIDAHAELCPLMNPELGR